MAKGFEEGDFVRLDGTVMAVHQEAGSVDVKIGRSVIEVPEWNCELNQKLPFHKDEVVAVITAGHFGRVGKVVECKPYTGFRTFEVYVKFPGEETATGFIQDEVMNPLEFIKEFRDGKFD